MVTSILTKKLILCLGPVCSGKTTWSKKFVRDTTEYYRLSYDELKQMSFCSMSNDRVDREFDTYYSNIAALALSKGKNLVMDGAPLLHAWLRALISLSRFCEIRLFDIDPVQASVRNQVRKKETGIWIPPTEMQRYRKFYEDYITSLDFENLRSMNNVSVTDMTKEKEIY